MKNGLYSLHVDMLDGHPDRGSGVIVLRNGEMRGGNGSVGITGSYTVSGNRWKGELITKPHAAGGGTIFEDRESGIGVSGTFDGDGFAEATGTALLGKTSLTFKVTLRRLSEA